MLKTVGVAGLAWLVLGAAAGCGSGPESADNAGKITNAELAMQVRAKLNADPELASARLSVDTDAGNRQVSLSGVLASEQLRARAVSVVGAVLPGLVVKDSITVTPQQSVTVAKPKTPAKKTAKAPARKTVRRQRR